MPRDIAGVTVIAAEPDSAITLSTWAAPLSRQPGEPIILHADLRDAIPGARLTARPPRRPERQVVRQSRPN